MIILGLMMYSVIIGSASSALANLDSEQTARRQMLDRVLAYMRSRKVPDFFQKIIIDYYRHSWSMPSTNNELIAALPQQLRSRLSMIINRDLIDRIPVFQAMSIDVYLRMVPRLQHTTYLPGEYVAKQGDLGDDLFFIRSGKVDAVLPNGVTVFCTMKPGDFFGEHSLLFMTRRDASYRAVDFVDLFIMSRPDFTEMYISAPDFIREVQRVDIARQKRRLDFELAVLKRKKEGSGKVDVHSSTSRDSRADHSHIARTSRTTSFERRDSAASIATIQSHMPRKWPWSLRCCCQNRRILPSSKDLQPAVSSSDEPEPDEQFTNSSTPHNAGFMSQQSVHTAENSDPKDAQLSALSDPQPRSQGAPGTMHSFHISRDSKGDVHTNDRPGFAASVVGHLRRVGSKAAEMLQNATGPPGKRKKKKKTRSRQVSADRSTSPDSRSTPPHPYHWREFDATGGVANDFHSSRSLEDFVEEDRRESSRKDPYSSDPDDNAAGDSLDTRKRNQSSTIPRSTSVSNIKENLSSVTGNIPQPRKETVTLAEVDRALFYPVPAMPGGTGAGMPRIRTPFMVSAEYSSGSTMYVTTTPKTSSSSARPASAITSFGPRQGLSNRTDPASVEPEPPRPTTSAVKERMTSKTALGTPPGAMTQPQSESDIYLDALIKEVLQGKD
jgi:voltage-gated potassium channel